MVNNRLNGNNGWKPFPGLSQKEDLKFPITFHLKAVLEISTGEEKHKQNLEAVFKSLEIDYLFKNNKSSNKGNYISFTYRVKLISKAQMEQLYEVLKGVEGLKFAL